MLKLFIKDELLTKKDAVPEVTTSNKEINVSTVIPDKSKNHINYVNLGRIIKDNSPLVLEYLDNEITILKKKIALLEEERLLVDKLFQVTQEKDSGTKPVR